MIIVNTPIGNTITKMGRINIHFVWNKLWNVCRVQNGGELKVI